MDKLLAIIPARGGSKGLPGKNIMSLFGKPLIAWSIEAARNAHCITKMIVSTDDFTIKEISNAYKAETPFLRPAHLALDNTLGIDVVLHAIEHLPDFEYVCMLQPTSPLRTGEDIDKAFNYFLKSGANACVSVIPTIQSPFWTFELSKNGHLKSLFTKEEFPKRRQEIPATYFLNGAIYIAKTQWLIKSKSFITDETIAYIMDKEKSIDIDTIEDFNEAEKVLTKLHLLNK
jgi:N-acylneuraminate cytidylyltransferase